MAPVRSSAARVGDRSASARSGAPPDESARPEVVRWDADSAFRAYFHEVWRILRRLGIDESDLDDAAQEVFLVVHRRAGDFEGRSSVRTWVFGVALRTARAWRRRARLRRLRTVLGLDHRLEPRDLRTPEVLYDRALAAEALQRCLDRLSPAHRELFVCVELEGLSIAAAARLLNLRLGTAYSRFEKARQHFRKSVDRELLRGTSRRQHAGA
jgi:RNA polymerase sigma-70 factor (ECF subfamily)